MQRESSSRHASSGQARGLVQSRPMHLLLLALVALAAYGNAFHGPFVFDDESSIVNNPVLKDLGHFVSGAGYAYNPRRFLGYLSFALNYKFGGLDTTGYHAVNVAIHVLNGWAVYFLAAFTLRTPFFENRRIAPFYCAWFPLITALLFLAHPVQTQAVTYVVQRLASLATLFYLLAVVCYVRARLLLQENNGLRPQAVAHFLLAAACAAMAMRTKEIAATLPFVVLAYELSFFGAPSRKRLATLAPVLLALAAVIPLGMLTAGQSPGELLSDVNELTRQSQFIPRGDYLLTQFSVIVTYLRLLLLPIGQNLDYDYPIRHSFFAPEVFLCFLLLCILLGAAAWLYLLPSRRTVADRLAQALPWTRPVAFGISWFFIALSVESSVIPIADVIYEHRLYLPSVGAFMAVVSLVPLLFPDPSPRVPVALAAVVVAVLAVVTWQRNLVWGDEISLWSDVVAKSPGKFRPHNNLGNVLNAKGRYREAVEHYRAAIAARPDFADAHNNLGTAYQKMGLLDAAAAAYREALRLKPDYADAILNLGSLHEVRGEAEEAARLYRAVIKDRPGHAAAHNNLGVVLVTGGAPDQAAAEFREAIRLNPDFLDAYVNLGETYLKMGRVEEAAGEFHALLEKKPGSARAHYNLGVIADLKGSLDDAIRCYRTALAVKPDYAEALSNLGIDYAMKGMPDQALDCFIGAIRIAPDDADFHYNLAEAYESKGWHGKAKEERLMAGRLEAAKMGKMAAPGGS